MQRTRQQNPARTSEPNYRQISCSDSELLARLWTLTHRSREVGRELLVHLAEVDRRRLYLSEACSSMFVYCTQRLGFSEGAAYRRIHVARLSRRLPLVLDYYSSGQVHLAGLVALAPHLTRANQRELLEAAKGKGKRAIEMWLAQRFPAANGDGGSGKVPRTVLRPIPVHAAGSTGGGSRTRSGDGRLPAGNCSREQFESGRPESVNDPLPPATADRRIDSLSLQGPAPATVSAPGARAFAACSSGDTDPASAPSSAPTSPAPPFRLRLTRLWPCRTCTRSHGSPRMRIRHFPRARSRRRRSRLHPPSPPRHRRRHISAQARTSAGSAQPQRSRR